MSHTAKVLTIDPAQALDELVAMLPGQVTVPGQPGWDQERLSWVRSVDQQPRAVVTVADEEDVIATVRWAAQHGMSVAAQPIGHGATVALNGSVLLRTRALDGITIDVEGRTARVGAGVKWGELLSAAGKHGLTGLAGSNADPTVVGYTLGGGLGWFSRKYGIAAHGVLAFDVVGANGLARRVTAAGDPDLFWALCGGGGDFAIVLAMEITLHPAPHVHGGRLLWPIEMASPVLHAFRDITRSAPDELTLWSQLLRFPDDPAVPEPLRGGAFISVDVTFLGAAEDAERHLEPLHAIPALVLDTLGTVPLAALGDICAEPVDPMPTSEFSGLLKDLDDESIDAVVAVAGAGSGSPLVILQLRHFGGAYTRASETDGPVGAIHEPYHLLCLGIPSSPEAAAAILATFGATTAALAGHLSDRRTFNSLTTADPPSAFSPSALARLRDVKRATDPDGVIRSNRPVLRLVSG